MHCYTNSDLNGVNKFSINQKFQLNIFLFMYYRCTFYCFIMPILNSDMLVIHFLYQVSHKDR